MSSSLVSIIIPHWNGVEVLSECLQSLQLCSYPSLEIIVVDNASSDGSQAFVRERYPAVRLVENERNYGYAGGCNRGVAVARGEYLLFLNNDTVQDPEWVQYLVTFLEEHPGVAAVQPKILNYFQRGRFDYAGAAGGQLDVLVFPFARGRVFLEQEEDRGQYDEAARIFWSSGTACLVRKEVFIAAGRFDESFFAHMEEIDLCWRFHLMGHEVWAEPRAVVYHRNAVSLPMHAFRKYYLNHRNSLLMLLSNYNLPLTLYLFPFRYALEWVAVFYALYKFDFRHIAGILSAHTWVLFHPGLVWRRRRRVRRVRKLKDQAVLDSFYRGSVVLDHYLWRRRTYLEIISSPLK